MKRSYRLVMTFAVIFGLAVVATACSGGGSAKQDVSSTQSSPAELSATDQNTGENSANDNEESAASGNTDSQAASSSEANTSISTGETNASGTLVVYFSCTGRTKQIAEYIAEAASAELFEIMPVDQYTSEDLNYNDSNSRTTLEMNDPAVRPEIANVPENFDAYDTIYLGYPIWWGEAPRILDTFAETYDFSGKTIIPFCTSGGSGIGSSAKTLAELAGSGEWMDGKKFSGNESADAVAEWVNGL